MPSNPTPPADRFLPRGDLVRAREVLSADGIAVDDIQLTHQGWDNSTFLVNGNLIVRFPRHEEVQFHHEIWALRAMKAISPLPIPEVTHVGNHPPYVAYPWIPGVMLDARRTELSFADRRQLIDEVVGFFAAMHRLLSVEDARQQGIGDDTRVLDGLDQRFDPSQPWFPSARDAYRRRAASSRKPVVLHNDLHPANILVAEASDTIAAIIDFGDIAIGDPVTDLNYLLEIDPTAEEWIAERYVAYGGQPVTGQEIGDTYLLLTLLHYLEPDQSEEEAQFLRQLIREYLAV